MEAAEASEVAVEAALVVAVEAAEAASVVAVGVTEAASVVAVEVAEEVQEEAVEALEAEEVALVPDLRLPLSPMFVSRVYTSAEERMTYSSPRTSPQEKVCTTRSVFQLKTRTQRERSKRLSTVPGTHSDPSSPLESLVELTTST